MLTVTDDHYSVVYLLNKEKCLWLFSCMCVRTQSCVHACLCAVCEGESRSERQSVLEKRNNRGRESTEKEKRKRKKTCNNGKSV